MKDITRGKVLKLPSRRWTSRHAGDVNTLHVVGKPHLPVAQIIRRTFRDRGDLPWGVSIELDSGKLKCETSHYDAAKDLANAVALCRAHGLHVTDPEGS